MLAAAVDGHSAASCVYVLTTMASPESAPIAEFTLRYKIKLSYQRSWQNYKKNRRPESPY